MSTKSYPKKQDDDALESIAVYEEDDEINLLDYLTIIWNRKWFILTATALPTLVVGLLLFLFPRSYTMSYSYDVRSESSSWNLNEKNYNVMLSRFYSEENLSKLADKMQQAGLDDYARRIRDFVAGSLVFVEFSTDPVFFDLSTLNITDQTQLRDILNMQASLLNVKITGKPKAEMLKISSIIRDNIENVISLYPIEDHLETELRINKDMQSQIESMRFSSQLTLKQSRDVLASLKNIKPIRVENSETNVTLQFDIGEQNEYMPLSYQIHATESKIINLEHEISTTEVKFQYYTDLAGLNESLLAVLNSNISGEYSISQFKTYLASLPNTIEKTELKDYLISYAKNIENRISASQPVTESPRVYSVARGTVKKSVLVLVAALMISVFAAFLMEAVKKSGSSLLEKRF